MNKSRLDPANQPGYVYEPYHSTARRAPVQASGVSAAYAQRENRAACSAIRPLRETDHDLTRQRAGEPIGQRMIVEGQVVDEDGKPLPQTLVEVWQTNAAGRYRHKLDDFPAPLDPNFKGHGRMLTDENGKYRFLTVKPGAYPWNNHPNAWRPAHIHFSLFGPSFVSRFITQMYFEGDPMLEYDPVFQAVPGQGETPHPRATSIWAYGRELGARLSLQSGAARTRCHAVEE